MVHVLTWKQITLQQVDHLFRRRLIAVEVRVKHSFALLTSNYFNNYQVVAVV